MNNLPNDFYLTQHLMLAVVLRAVQDWKALCRGAHVPCPNFDELTHFFKHDCGVFLKGTNISPAGLYSKMMVQRARTKTKRDKAEVAHG